MFSYEEILLLILGTYLKKNKNNVLILKYSMKNKKKFVHVSKMTETFFFEKLWSKLFKTNFDEKSENEGHFYEDASFKILLKSDNTLCASNSQSPCANCLSLKFNYPILTEIRS